MLVKIELNVFSLQLGKYMERNYILLNEYYNCHENNGRYLMTVRHYAFDFNFPSAPTFTYNRGYDFLGVGMWCVN